MIRKHSENGIPNLSAKDFANITQALGSGGHATVASQIFGNQPDFKPPGGTEPIKAAGRDCKWPNRMSIAEAGSNGFLKEAASCGWGIYKTEDLDGGLGSIWYLEAGEDGQQYLVKQTDAAGDVVRRVQALKKTAAETCARCGGEANPSIMSKFNTDNLCMACKEKEKQHPDYSKADEAEVESVKGGDMNFPGVGKPKDL